MKDLLHIDNRIAQHIFGYTWQTMKEINDLGWAVAEPDVGPYLLKRPLTQHAAHVGYNLFHTGNSIPKFSTDLAAAWTVLEEMDCRYVLESTPNGHRCCFGQPSWDGVEEETPALAICKAALKFKGVEL